jgi:hypothetical protein
MDAMGFKDFKETQVLRDPLAQQVHRELEQLAQQVRLHIKVLRTGTMETLMETKLHLPF